MENTQQTSANQPEKIEASNNPALAIDNLRMTREDIIAAYKLILKRMPENEEVVTPRIGLFGLQLLPEFLLSDEFAKRPEAPDLIYSAIKELKSNNDVSE